MRRMMAPDLALKPHTDIRNPVLSADDITDVEGAKFVADPFYIYNNNIHNLFFEVLDGSGKGLIGHAESRDGRNWSYQQIILEEPFHLSFPYVFHYDSEWYLIPEYVSKKEIQPLRIYKAEKFPSEWYLSKTTLNRKKVADPVLLHRNNIWYLFVQTRRVGVSLYFSHSLESEAWIKHPESPITTTYSMGRMAGRPFINGGDLHLLFQNGRYLYGEQVRCCRVTLLDRDNYEHREISTSPLVRGQFNYGWNDRGMHHVDVSPYTDHGQDFVIVDGCDENENWSIGLYQPSRADYNPISFSRSQKLRRYRTIFKDKWYNIYNLLRKT